MAPVLDAHGEAYTTTFTQGVRYGLKITTNFACTLQKITKPSLVTANTAYLYEATGVTELASGSFTGADATFSYSLANATSYLVVVGNANSSNYDGRYGARNVPYNKTNVNFVDDWKIGTGGNQGTGNICVESVTTDTSTGTNAQINIGDVWKEVPSIKINIGDVWKEVSSAQINIGDVWKSVF